ncbi:MAG: cytochrome c3 family protein [Bacillota bacterium]
MGKIKSILVFISALACVLAYTAPAFAWTHGGFGSTTDACAGCHVAHAAPAPKLLKAGPSQTQFCFLCHGDGTTSAPYDVEDGYTRATVGGGVYPSTAGGFVNEFVDANGNYVIDGGELKSVTSRHNVWGFVYGEENTAAAGTTDKYFWIPGGSNQFSSNGFVCSSCHDPHDGGRTPDGSGYIKGSAGAANPRLLRRSITVQDAAYTDLYVAFKLATVGSFSYSTTASGVYRVTAYARNYSAEGDSGDYAAGTTRWCGACHNKFQTDEKDLPDTKHESAGPGHAVYQYGMHRHPVNVPHALLPSTADGSMDTGTPLETPTAAETGCGTCHPDMWAGAPTGDTVGNLGCLTCHRAHSSAAAVAGWASAWPRDATDPATGDAISDTSALLRMNNRGICYNCHGAGEYNCWNDIRFDGISSADGVPDCGDVCH